MTLVVYTVSMHEVTPKPLVLQYYVVADTARLECVDTVVVFVSTCRNISCSPSCQAKYERRVNMGNSTQGARILTVYRVIRR